MSKIANAMENGLITIDIFLKCFRHHKSTYFAHIAASLRYLLLNSYLLNRRQCPKYRVLNSVIQHGVPQGSILGTLFFLIYINNFQNCLENSNLLMYADDTNVYIKEKNINTFKA